MVGGWRNYQYLSLLHEGSEWQNFNFYTVVERDNDDAKRNYFSSNLHDLAGEVLKEE